MSILALLGIRGMDDQRRDLILLECELRLAPRTGIPDDSIQFVGLVIGAGDLLALDAEVTQVEMRALPDQVVEDSPHARILDAFLFDACRIKEQGRCRVSIGAIDGVLKDMEMGNEALRICRHHLTSFSSMLSTFKHLFSYYTPREHRLQMFASIV